MSKQLVFLAALVGALGSFAPNASAQALDSINSINGQTFESNAQNPYFNRRDCGLDPAAGTGGIGGGSPTAMVLKAGPEDTTFEIRLENAGTALTQVWLWTGVGGAECERLEQRNSTQGTCAEIAGNPKTVGSNFLVTGLTLQDLLNAESGLGDIVDCESSGLSGTPYKIFAFRNEPPSGDVAASDYGVTDFYIDVEPPAAPLVNTAPQEASTFTISWSNPNPPDDIQAWLAYASDIDDSATAVSLDNYVQLSARTVSISASELGLTEPGETAYVFMQAFDQAFVSDQLGGNQSELSESVEVTFVDNGGVDAGVDGGEPPEPSGGSGGCATSPAATSGPAAWLLALLFVLRLGRRTFV